MKTPKGTIHFPDPASIDALLDQYFFEYNSLQPKAFSDVVRLYLKFLSIHPFVDGNGRVGRVLYEASLIKNGFIGPTTELYRLSSHPSDYPNAIAFTTKTGELHPDYWIENLKWSESYYSEVVKIATEHRQKVNNKIGLFQFSRSEENLMSEFWKLPVQTPSSLIGLTSSKIYQNGINDLISKKIIAPHTLETAPNKMHFLCKDSLSLHRCLVDKVYNRNFA
jgi:hypothetical protein